MLSEWLIIQGIIERGLIFSITVMAIYITSRIIRFDDLSVEGSFGLGGALMALLLTRNVPWAIALPLVTIAGAIAGLATGLLIVESESVTAGDHEYVFKLAPLINNGVL